MLFFPENSIPANSITELSGPLGCGKTELALRFLAQQVSAPDARPIAWIEEAPRANIHPRAFPERGVKLSQVLFVQTLPPETPTVLQQLLASQAFGTIIVGAHLTQESDLRRLQIGAERARARVILLTVTPTREGSRWMIARQVRVHRRDEEILTDVLKDGKKPVAL